MNSEKETAQQSAKQPAALPDLDGLRNRLTAQNYIVDDELLVTLFAALKLNRPLLIEGEAGVGKTEVAKAAAGALGRELIRLQCYEGLDESKALYEWNYQKQLLAIQVGMGRNRDAAGENGAAGATAGLFGPEYLLERPLLRSIRSETPVVLLIDEIDKSDEEFEAFLLELLSEMQVTIPELGTVRARSTPFVVLTSNHVRPLSAALRRRCAYLYIGYPSVERETEIIKSRLPEAENILVRQVAETAARIRENERLTRKPSVAETIDWAAALQALGLKRVDRDALRKTAGFLLKNSQDAELVLNDGELFA